MQSRTFKRKFLAVTLSATMVMGCAVTGISVNAAGTSAKNFEYSKNYDGTVTITNYNGNSTDVVIPSEIYGRAVSAIGSNAFDSKWSLSSVTIPDTVVNIGDYAFYGCENLIDLTIPSSVKFIGSYTFDGCTSLEDLTIPDSVVEIGDNAFSSTLWYENQPDGMVYAGKVAYKYKGYLSDGETLTLNSDTTAISNYAFAYCGGLAEITIPDSVKYIGTSAFEGCDSLTSVSIGSSVVEIGSSAFSNCTGLTSISIPSSVRYIGGFAFSACTNLADITVDTNNPNYSSQDGVLFNDDKTELILCPAQKSGEYTIPDTVEVIESSAFDSCERLTAVTIPDSVTQIGYGAFIGCTGLISVEIPGSVEVINNSTFMNCSSLQSVTIPNGVIEIGESAFSGCSSLTSVEIPESVININSSVFSDCSALTSITVDENNEFYASDNGVLFDKDMTELMIYPDSKAGEYTIPDSVSSIGYAVFSGCTGLTGITIPESITAIDWNAFENCTSLKSITIPNSVTYLGGSVFSGCTSLESVTLPESITGIDYGVFYGCSSLTSITIPDNITSIGDNVFSDCTSLADITIPDSVTDIGYDAFFDTAWLNNQPDGVVYAGRIVYAYNGEMPEGATLTIKDGTTGINSSAFSYQSNLTCIIIPTSVTNIGYGAFDGCDNLTICGESNSYAETYANENGITFAENLANNTTLSALEITKGGSITITGAAIGGTAPYQYSFLCKHSTATSWTTLTSFGTTSKRVWKPTKSGIYSVRTKVKDASGTVSTKDFTLVVNPELVNNTTLSKTAINSGSSITIQGMASGGTAPYSYSFLCKHSTATSWTTLTSYGTTSLRVWKPTKTGTYSVRTKVKDASGMEVIKDFTLTVGAALENNSTLSKTTINYGDSLTIKGAASGGAEPYSYSFLCKHSSATSWTTLTSYGTTSTRVWKPTKTGTYSVRTKVKDANGKEVVKDFTLTVN
ncbi:MAG: leucine-rich repeat protein [Acutalibacteraceae bacterium]